MRAFGKAWGSIIALFVMLFLINLFALKDHYFWRENISLTGQFSQPFDAEKGLFVQYQIDGSEDFSPPLEIEVTAEQQFDLPLPIYAVRQFKLSQARLNAAEKNFEPVRRVTFAQTGPSILASDLDESGIWRVTKDDRQPEENPMRLIAWVLGSFLAAFFVCLFGRLGIQLWRERKNSEKGLLHYGAKYAAFYFGVYVLYSLSIGPGLAHADYFYTLQAILLNLWIDNLTYVLPIYTLTFWGWTGSSFGLELFQAGFSCVLFAYAAAQLRLVGCNERWVSAFIGLSLIACPFYVMAVQYQRDTPLNLFYLALMLCVVSLALRLKAKINQIHDPVEYGLWFGIILFGSLSWIFRPDGFFHVFLLVPVLIWLVKANWQKSVAAIVSIGVLWAIVDVALLPESVEKSPAYKSTLLVSSTMDMLTDVSYQTSDLAADTAILDQVIDVEAAKDIYSPYQFSWYWAVARPIDEKAYEDLKQLYLRAVIENPVLHLQNRFAFAWRMMQENRALNMQSVVQDSGEINNSLQAQIGTQILTPWLMQVAKTETSVQALLVRLVLEGIAPYARNLLWTAWLGMGCLAVMVFAAKRMPVAASLAMITILRYGAFCFFAPTTSYKYIAFAPMLGFLLLPFALAEWQSNKQALKTH